MDVNMSLLDAMAVQAGCEFLSDLRYIDDLQRFRLARTLEKVSPQSGTLFEWNDALEYLTGEPHQPTPEAAKERLMRSLAAPRTKGWQEEKGGIST